MAKLNAQHVSSGTGPLKTETTSTGLTYEGGKGFTRDSKTELFLLATTMFAGEDAFYEKGKSVNDRAIGLMRELAVSDYRWVTDFLPWLRNSANIRTMAIMLAAEAVHARLAKGLPGAGPDGKLTNRELISTVQIRPDEPCEMTAYWTGKFGKDMPRCVKRGIGDACTRMWHERNVMRWDKPGRPVRFADVLELVHPSPRRVVRRDEDGEPALDDQGRAVLVPDQRQRKLWDYLITERRGHLTAGDGHPDYDYGCLTGIKTRKDLGVLIPGERHQLAGHALDGDGDAKAVLSKAAAGQWEWLLSWLGEPSGAHGPHVPLLSKREQWGLVIPDLGYMALIRNLRNFDEAGLKTSIANKIQAHIADPAEVARSKQLPFRFLSAYLNAPSLKWGQALEQALQACVPNIPELDGRNLVLLDMSGSMLGEMSGGSKRQKGKRPTMMQAGALFGVALAVRNPGKVDVYGFADSQMAIQNIGQGKSILKTVELITDQAGKVGYGTQIEAAIRACYSGHDRVFVFTDMQTMPTDAHPAYFGDDIARAVPDKVHVYGFNLAGYSQSAMAAGSPFRHEMGGLTDHTFGLVDLLEKGLAGKWPWDLDPKPAGVWGDE